MAREPVPYICTLVKRAEPTAEEYVGIRAWKTLSVTFDPSAVYDMTEQGRYANQPYKIYVCRAFWSAPDLGRDSRAGTLVHEMSHFNVTAATDDWVYGASGAHSLALSNPTKAIDNADNHENFAEDQ